MLPHLHSRAGDVLYLHGSTGARAFLAGGSDGLDVCVTVTLTDGLVLAGSAFHHSINCRAVVAHGRATLVTDPAEKTSALSALVEAVAAGRTSGTRAPNSKELAATAVLRLDLTEVSLKARTAGPSDETEDSGCRTGPGYSPSPPRPGCRSRLPTSRRTSPSRPRHQVDPHRP